MRGQLILYYERIRAIERSRKLDELEKLRDGLSGDDTNRLLRLLIEIENSAGGEDVQSGAQIVDNYNHSLESFLDSLKRKESLDASIKNLEEELLRLRSSWRCRIGNILVRSYERIAKRESKRDYITELIRSVRNLKGEAHQLSEKRIENVPRLPYLKPLPGYHFSSPVRPVRNGHISMIVLAGDEPEALNSTLSSFLEVNTFRKYEILVVGDVRSSFAENVVNEYRPKLNIDCLLLEEELISSYILNKGADLSQSQYLLFMRPGAQFNADLLKVLVDQYATSSTGMLGVQVQYLEEPGMSPGGQLKLDLMALVGIPDILNPVFDETIIPSEDYYRGTRAIRANGGVLLKPGQEHLFPVLKNTYPEGDGENNPVPMISGELIFMERKEFILAGGFDLNLFNGYECAEICIRLTRKLKKEIRLARGPGISVSTPHIGELEAKDLHNLGFLIREHGSFLRAKYIEECRGHAFYWEGEALAQAQNLVDHDTAANGTLVNGGTMGDGHTTIDISLEDKEFAGRKLRIALKLPVPNEVNPHVLGDYFFGLAIKKSLNRLGYPVRIDFLNDWYDHSILKDDVVIAIRGLYRYQPRPSHINILWNISHPKMISKEEYESYDQVFVASESYADSLREALKVNVEPLLQCTDPELFFPGPSDKKFETDLLFVGNWRARDRKAVYYAAEKNIPVSVFGRKWEGHIPDDFIKGQYIPNESLRHYYSNCQVMVNDHWNDMAEHGFINNRIFDAMACGAIVLTDPVAGMDQLFRQGICIYKDADEFKQKAGWIDANRDQLKAEALENSNIIRREHTFDRRVKDMVMKIEKINREKK